ncbi:hypothetical protein Trydic_g4879 [Trypoxylus dichotomus]
MKGNKGNHLRDAKNTLIMTFLCRTVVKIEGSRVHNGPEERGTLLCVKNESDNACLVTAALKEHRSLFARRPHIGPHWTQGEIRPIVQFSFGRRCG